LLAHRPLIQSTNSCRTFRASCTTDYAPIYRCICGITFAFLGAPAHNTSKRNFSIGALSSPFSAADGGFACSVLAVKSPFATARSVPDAAAPIERAFGSSSVVRLEPPAALLEAVNKSNARLLRCSDGLPQQ